MSDMTCVPSWWITVDGIASAVLVVGWLMTLVAHHRFKRTCGEIIAHLHIENQRRKP